MALEKENFYFICFAILHSVIYIYYVGSWKIYWHRNKKIAAYVWLAYTDSHN